MYEKYFEQCKHVCSQLLLAGGVLYAFSVPYYSLTQSAFIV
ncbi:MAG: hypothetical protein AAF387_16795 [Pseudomonadota bacterium]